MGVVYEAVHCASGKHAAVKTVPAGDELTMLALRREIRALGELRHPGIARILDVGTTLGCPWFAAEYVRGNTLESHQPRESQDDGLRSVPARLLALLTLARGLCHALSYLHGEGFCHGDLKPSNIIVSPQGVPVLVDFGLAAQVSAAIGKAGSAAREALTATFGGGTLSYISPEVLRGEPPDARSDLYSLGCILFELCAQRPPHVGTRQQIIRGHCSGAPPALLSVAPGLPPRLGELVAGLLAKKPADRIGYADVVDHGLAALGVPPVAWPVTPPRPRPYVYRARCVGRRHALDRLERALAKSLAGDLSGAVLRGESGTGKTRLLKELAAFSRHHSARLLLGEADPRDCPPLGLFQKPLRAIADSCIAGGEGVTRAFFGDRLAVIAPFAPCLWELPGAPDAAPAASLPEGLARARLHGCLVDTVLAVAEDQTVALLLDDVQAADELSWEALAALARAARQRRQAHLLVVLACRDEPLAGLDALQGVFPELEVIAVGALDGDDVGEVVGDMLALRPVPAIFAAALARRTGGNPLFVAEYVRAAVAQGLIERDNSGHWHCPTDLGGEREAGSCGRPLPLPDSLCEMLLRRLELLPPAVSAVVDAAAVLGARLEKALLSALLGGDGETTISAAIHELSRHQILDHEDAGYLAFRHGSMQLAAYERLPVAARAALHARAAELLESNGDRSVPGHFARLAWHWAQAGNASRAAEHYLAAARWERERYDLRAAEAHYRTLLDLAGGGGERRLAALAEYAGTLYAVGRLAPAQAAYDELLAGAEQAGDGALLAEGWQGSASVAWRQGRYAAAWEQGQRALELWQRLGRPDKEAHTHNLLAGVLKNRGELGRAITFGFRALRLQQKNGSAIGQARCLNTLAAMRWEAGEAGEAEELTREAIALSEAAKDRRWQAINLACLAGIHGERGLFAEMEAVLRDTLAILREIGDRTTEGTVLANLAYAIGNQGQAEAAWDCYEESLAALRAVGDRYTEARTMRNMAELRGSRGERAQSAASYEQAGAIYRELGDRSGAGMCLLGSLEQQRLSGVPAAVRRSVIARARVDFATGAATPADEAGLAMCQIEEGLARREAGEEASEQLAAAAALAATIPPRHEARMRVDRLLAAFTERQRQDATNINEVGHEAAADLSR